MLFAYQDTLQRSEDGHFRSSVRTPLKKKKKTDKIPREEVQKGQTRQRAVHACDLIGTYIEEQKK